MRDIPWGFESPKESPPGKLAALNFLSPALLARQGWAGALSVL